MFKLQPVNVTDIACSGGLPHAPRDVLCLNFKFSFDEPTDPAEVVQLVEDTNAPKSTDKPLKTYEGREEELLRHLRKMKVKLDQQAEIKRLVLVVKPGKTYQELAATYAGKEEELIKNLQKMEAKQKEAAKKVEEGEAKRRKVRALVAATNPGKSADELFTAYAGWKDELIANLEIMKAKQQRASQHNLSAASPRVRSTHRIRAARKTRPHSS